jgi:hypothetical protein
MQFWRVWALSVLGAIVFGVVHDQVTARVCVEYFTIGHPRIFGEITSPTFLALGWGVVATWWAGALVGLPLAVVSTAGPWRPLRARELLRPLATLLASMGLCSTIAGLFGRYAATHDMLQPNDFLRLVPPAAQVGFVTDAFAHLAAYASGFLGGAILWVYAGFLRRRLALRSQA